MLYQPRCDPSASSFYTGSQMVPRWGGISVPEEDARAPVEVYRSYLKEGELGFQRCRGCRSAIFYPRVLCPVCGSTSLAWETSGGRGTVYATTAVYHRDREPHNVALVDLKEGFRMMSRVEGVLAGEVEVGMDVVFEVREEDGGPVVVFVPVAETGEG